VTLNARAARWCSERWSSRSEPGAAWLRVRAAPAAGLDRSGLPSRSTTTAAGTRSSSCRTSTRSPRCARTSGRSLAGGLGVSCFRSATAGQDRMFGRRWGPEDRPPDRRRAAGRSPGAPWPHRFGQQIEIEQGVEIGRPSRLQAVAEGSADRIDGSPWGNAVVVARGGTGRLVGGYRVATVATHACLIGATGETPAMHFCDRSCTGDGLVLCACHACPGAQPPAEGPVVCSCAWLQRRGRAAGVERGRLRRAAVGGPAAVMAMLGWVS